ncbi:MAG: glycosyltransferase [Anaerolineales bacterium]
MTIRNGSRQIAPTQVTLAIEAWNARDLDDDDLFKRSLRSLANQDYPIDQCQILVIVDASVRERDLEWILRDLPTATFIRFPNATYFRSKNRALDAATGAIVVFADSDVRYTPEWLQRILDTFHDDEVNLVVGKTMYEPGFLSGTQNLVDWAATRPHSGWTDWFYGNNLAVRRARFQDFRFREDLGPHGGGAVDIARHELRAAGIRPWYSAEAKGWHHLAPFTKKRLRIGGYQIHYRRLSPDTPWSWVVRVPALAPFFVTGGSLIKAYQRAWTLRKSLPGRGSSLPIYFVTMAGVKIIEFLGAAFISWAPSSMRTRVDWFTLPEQASS